MEKIYWWLLRHGSGKTAVLVERVIRKLIEEKIDIDRLLVVTFTNAAASQMREKILKAIYKKLEEEPQNSHLQRQIVLMNKASISTIHAFCLEVIRNHFYEIDVSPNFRMGDSSELELLKQETIEDLFEEKYEEKNQDFLKLTESYTSYRGDEDLKELVFRIDRFIQSTPFPKDWLEEAVAQFDVTEKLEQDFGQTIWGKILLENMQEEVKGYCFELEAIEKKLAREGLSKFALVVAEDKQIMREFTNLSTWDEAFTKANSIRFPNWPIDKKEVSNLKDEAKEKRAKIKKNFESSIENMKLYSSKEAMKDIAFMESTLIALKDLVLAFEERYQEKKKEKNVIDFHDIEHFALQILMKKKEDGTYIETEVAKSYREKFVEIAIDEYQDSNLIQDCILSTISRGNNLFMVGDVKQSIYKFRQARPKLFLDKYEQYVVPEEKNENATGLKILLFKNFRSRKEVLEITNEVFQAIMSKRLGEIEYTEKEYLNLGANYEEPENPSTNFAGKAELHVINLHKQEDEEEEIEEPIENSELEAKFVAGRIHELLEKDYQIKDKQGYRKATYKDIVILLRAANSIAPIYEKEFMAQGIPVFSDTSSEYLDSTEIATILALLKVIDNPNQDIALVTVLRSPIYHFDDNELITIRLKDKTASFYGALQKAKEECVEPLKTKINNFFAQMDLFRKRQEYMPLHEFIWFLYETTGYRFYVTLTPNGALKMANLKMLFERAKEYESASFKGLYNFVHYIERLKKSNQDLGAAKIIGENENVVRIMSIHKSKGLEFPIVFLCGMGKGFNFRDLNEPILLHQDIGFGPKYIHYERQIEYNTLAKEAIKKIAKTEAISEEMRVLYVALTRAKEKLIMVGVQKEVEKEMEEKQELLENLTKQEEKLPSQMVKQYKTYLDWLELVYLNKQKQQQDILEVSVHTPEEIASRKEEKEENQIKKETVSEKLKEELKEKIEWQYTKKELANIPSKSSVTKMKEINSNEQKEEKECILEVPQFLSPQKELTGAKRGTIMHFVLQKLDLKKEYTMQELEELLNELVAKQLLSEQEVQTVSRVKLQHFLESDMVKEIRQAQEIYQEKPFYLYLPAKEIYGGEVEEKVVVQGIIDLYYRNKEGKLVLVDYKTDYVENRDKTVLIQKYQKQIESYKRAIEQATGEKVEKSYIYSLYLDEAIAL